MGAREPAVAVKLVVVKMQLTYQLRMFRAASLHAVANVENHQAVAPIGEISETIFDLQIMQVATNKFAVAARRGYRCRYCASDFPTRHFFRMLHVREINHAH